MDAHSCGRLVAYCPRGEAEMERAILSSLGGRQWPFYWLFELNVPFYSNFLPETRSEEVDVLPRALHSLAVYIFEHLELCSNPLCDSSPKCVSFLLENAFYTAHGRAGCLLCERLLVHLHSLFSPAVSPRTLDHSYWSRTQFGAGKPLRAVVAGGLCIC